MLGIVRPAAVAASLFYFLAGAAFADEAPGSAALGNPCNFPKTSEVRVSSASALASALSRAKPGQMIRLASGTTYQGRFKITVDGRANAPIVLCGGRGAVLDGGSLDTGYVLHLSGAEHWVLSGFTVKRGRKGVMLDGANHNLLTGLSIRDIGEEAVHFRKFSSDNVLSYSAIRNTGRVNRGYGEGVYIGSPYSQWQSMTGSSSTPDRSDRNRVLNNVFGPYIAAEHIDVKEGTADGEISGNTFDGTGISRQNYADSWIDLKGNGYVVEDNTGVNSPADGFQLHVARAGWGNNNRFSNNEATVNGPGYGFNLQNGSSGNNVLCDNVVKQAGSGFANVKCAEETNGTPGGDGVPPEEDDGAKLDGGAPPSQNFALAKWYLTLPDGSTVEPAKLSSGYTRDGIFFTDPASGGMAFRCPNVAGTTANSSYSRTELREMRAGTNSAKDDANNWRMAEGGTLRARLRVDRVSVSGDDAKVGRVIIGQIHGDDSEPIRLYFHKKPGEARGRIYAGHDTAANKGSYSRDIVGNTGGGGIALGETFGYEIALSGTRLTVNINRDGAAPASYAYDIDPAYRSDNLYFKAGVYNQNNTGSASDYVQATFFDLAVAHP